MWWWYPFTLRRDHDYCNVLRDDGISYGDYVEQRTYLLFLKMADERSRPPYNQISLIPKPYPWPALRVHPLSFATIVLMGKWRIDNSILISPARTSTGTSVLASNSV